MSTSFSDIDQQVAFEGLKDLCGATDEEIAELEAAKDPVAELIQVRNTNKGRTEEFACLLGYEPPEGVTVLSRRPLYLRPQV